MYYEDKESYTKYKDKIIAYTHKHTNGKIAKMLLCDSEYVHDAIVIMQLPPSKRRTLDKEFATLVSSYKKQLITIYGRSE